MRTGALVLAGLGILLSSMMVLYYLSGWDHWLMMVVLLIAIMILPLAFIQRRQDEFIGEDQYHLHP